MEEKEAIEEMVNYQLDKFNENVQEIKYQQYKEIVELQKILEEKDKETSKLTAESTEFESKVYELQDLEKEHQKTNGELREEVKRLEDDLYSANQIISDYIDTDKEIERLKKQIDLMSEQILKDNEYIYNEFDNMDIEKIKQYFENKVKEGK